MKLTPGFAAISILMGMLGLAACGQNSNQVVYQYPETAVLFDNFHILKTVYTSGEMKLYYRGMNLDGCQIECYDADFTKLSGEFEHMSGLMMGRKKIAEIPQIWLKAHLLNVVKSTFDYFDYWNYRRLLEVVVELIPELKDAVLSINSGTTDPDLIEIIDDYRDM